MALYGVSNRYVVGVWTDKWFLGESKHMGDVRTFQGRCHDTILLEAEPADRIFTDDFGLYRVLVSFADKKKEKMRLSFILRKKKNCWSKYAP